MKLHANAALSLKKRRLLVQRVVERGLVADEGGRGRRSQRADRAQVGRPLPGRRRGGLLDRPRPPTTSTTAPPRTASAVICALRRLRMTGAEIAEVLGMAETTVSGILTRSGLGRLGRLGMEPAQRYERSRPGELLHIDVKKLGRIEGGYGKRIAGRRRGNRPRPTARASPPPGRLGGRPRLRRRRHPPRLRRGAQRREGDDGDRLPSPRRSLLSPPRRHGRGGDDRQRLRLRSAVHAIACRALGIRHLRTRPYRPQTNGKAERFIRTMLGGWAYGAIYRSSAERTAALEGWLWRYNFRRPHGSLGRRPPAARLAELNNALGSYS